jgi:hypothetical protein
MAEVSRVISGKDYTRLPNRPAGVAQGFASESQVEYLQCVMETQGKKEGKIAQTR